MSEQLPPTCVHLHPEPTKTKEGSLEHLCRDSLCSSWFSSPVRCPLGGKEGNFQELAPRSLLLELNAICCLPCSQGKTSVLSINLLKPRSLVSFLEDFLDYVGTCGFCARVQVPTGISITR